MIRINNAILAYHSIPETATWFYDVAENYFEQHLSYLTSHLVIRRVADMSQQIQKTGHSQRVPCGITFDDGYLNNFTQAYPLLLKYEAPATIFVSTRYIAHRGNNRFSGRTMLNWHEIREMVASGLVDIGSHAHSHSDLTLLSETEVLGEIQESRRQIESELGTAPKVFAFPGGRYDHKALAAVRTSRLVPIMKRICIERPNQSLPLFVLKLYGIRDKLTYLRRGMIWQLVGR